MKKSIFNFLLICTVVLTTITLCKAGDKDVGYFCIPTMTQHNFIEKSDLQIANHEFPNGFHDIAINLHDVTTARKGIKEIISPNAFKVTISKAVTNAAYNSPDRCQQISLNYLKDYADIYLNRRLDRIKELPMRSWYGYIPLKILLKQCNNTVRPPWQPVMLRT